MSLRRRESRLEIVNAEGVLRVLRDVMVRRTDEGEFVAISTEAAIKGELLTIYFASDGNKPIPVRVLDSQPAIIDGSVRHQLRLTSVAREVVTPLDTTHDGYAEAE
jgi:hypothetical protein